MRRELACGLLIALGLAACQSSKTSGTAPKGAVSTVVRAQVARYQITRVLAEVMPANVRQDLTYDATSGAFTGTLVVPPGIQTVTATAYAGDTVVGVGTATG